MKTKTSNKLNILLIAITLLLIFVAGASAIGKTGSWLTDDEKIGFTVKVADINIVIEQTYTQTTTDDKGNSTETQVTRTIEDNGTIYLNTSIIEANKAYPLNVKITNNEPGDGYYVRFQALAVVNGVTYNINEYITSDFYKNANGWAYNTANSGSSAPLVMTNGQSKTIMGTMTIPATASAGKLSIASLQGKHFRLYLYIEGSPSANFDM